MPLHRPSLLMLTFQHSPEQRSEGWPPGASFCSSFSNGEPSSIGKVDFWSAALASSKGKGKIHVSFREIIFQLIFIYHKLEMKMCFEEFFCNSVEKTGGEVGRQSR